MDNNWRLDEIKLEFKTYGDDKDKYVGYVRFQNGEFESFKFKIQPNMAQRYIDLIANDIVKCASELGERLIVSLGLDNK